MTRFLFTQEPQFIVLLSYSRWVDEKSTATPNFYFSFFNPLSPRPGPDFSKLSQSATQIGGEDPSVRFHGGNPGAYNTHRANENSRRPREQLPQFT